ncbi:hypothetical protein ACIQ6Y_33970 [Streptomyces sp. NPDC096205]|uniref:hypothetical protein n=1 Tax=Streptomyces sp. NPDC096205 TaxID=3366081 RepID=UPI0038205E13
MANVAATRAAGPAASARVLGLIGAGAMLANVVGVPMGALAGQLMGRRGPFWALAALAAAAVPLIARTVPHDGPAQHTGSVRSEQTALRSGRLRHHHRGRPGRRWSSSASASAPSSARSSAAVWATAAPTR